MVLKEGEVKAGLVTETEMKEIRAWLATEFLKGERAENRFWNPFVSLAEAWMLEEYLINGDHGRPRLSYQYGTVLMCILNNGKRGCPDYCRFAHATAEQKTLGIYLAVRRISYKEWISEAESEATLGRNDQD